MTNYRGAVGAFTGVLLAGALSAGVGIGLTPAHAEPVNGIVVHPASAKAHKVKGKVRYTIPGMTRNQTTNAAYKAYTTYYGKDNSCRVDFLESYNGVMRDSKSAPPEMRDQVVKLTTKKARRLNRGKRVFILRKLDKYRGGCQFQDHWTEKGYKVAPLSMQRDPEFKGHGVIMVRWGDTTRVVARDGHKWVS